MKPRRHDAVNDEHLGQDGRLTGTIARIVRDRGFCFIKDSTGKDYFCHMSALQGYPFDSLQEGQKVMFESAASPKGPRAENVTIG